MNGDTGKAKKRKFETSKFVLGLVLATYFIGVVVGVRAAWRSDVNLNALFTYIGAPTGIAIGFYSWKAKAENVIKIAKENPDVSRDGINIGHIL